MADPLPIAGASVGDTLRFGTPTVTNSRWTVAPPGWDSLQFGKNLAVFDPDQNGAAVWFAFEQTYTPPDAGNIHFDFSGDRLVLTQGWDSCRFGNAWVTRTPSFETIGTDFLEWGAARFYDTTFASGSLDFTFEIDYTQPPSLNVPFVFGGDVVVTGATLGDMLRIGGIFTVENTAKQMWPNGFETLLWGSPRVSDQFDKNFIFTESYTPPPSQSVRFDFDSVGNLPITGKGFDSLQWGVGTSLRLVDIAITCIGHDSLQFGVARVYDTAVNIDHRTGVNFRFLEDPKYPSSSLNIPFYFSWINRIYPFGWDSAEFGVPWASHWVRNIYPESSDFVEFGSPTVWLWTQYATEAGGTDFSQWGNPERVWNFHTWMYPNGVDHLQWGTPNVWNFTQYVSPNGVDYLLWGLPVVENTAVPIYPQGVNFLDFGLPEVENTAQVIKQWGDDHVEFGTAVVTNVPDYHVTTNLMLLPPLVKVNVSYNPSVERPLVCRNEHWQQHGVFKEVGVDARHQDGVAAVVGVQAYHQLGANIETGVDHLLPPIFQPTTKSYVTPWKDATQVESGADLPHEVGVWISNRFEVFWQDAETVMLNFLHKSPGMTSGARQYMVVPWEQGKSFCFGNTSVYNNPVEVINGWQVWWQNAVVPQPGITFYPPEPPELPKCYTPNPHLVFQGLQVDVDGNLVFACEYVSPIQPPTQQVIPYRKVYIVMNSVKVFKKAGHIELPVLSFGLDIDMDSWAWGFTASFPRSVLPLIASVVHNQPVELEAEVNGEVFELLAESVSRNRSWQSTSISVSGRGKSAYLHEPYAPRVNFANTTDKTAQQLMIDALTYNGVSLGWGIDWGMDDWLVPNGAWSLQGTYMDAVVAIANACGAFVLPHAANNLLYIKPKYPAWPWNWEDVPLVDLIQIPSAVAETESIKWVNKPAYNGVYVSGVSVGTLALVKKLGTAGDLLAQMVTNSLITSAAAARQLGGTILSDTGRMAEMSISLPVLPETGIIRPGKLVKYVDGASTIIGLVRGNSVSMQGGPQLRQALELEIHYG